MIPAAITAAAVPLKLIPPSMPGAMGLRVVISRVRPGKAWPVSLDEVSAVSSAIEARASSRQTGGAKATMKPAMPRLAITWEAARPLRDSATCSRSFRARPRRVAPRVTAKTTSSSQKSFISLAAITKAMLMPASAPEALTPRASQAASAKARVVPKAIRRRLREPDEPGQRSRKPALNPAAKHRLTASATGDGRRWVASSVLLNADSYSYAASAYSKSYTNPARPTRAHGRRLRGVATCLWNQAGLLAASLTRYNEGFATTFI